MINLDNFEELIPSRILDRGYEIYSNFSFAQMFKTVDNEYHFSYHGSKFYNINITLDSEGNIIDSICSCPYDYSEHCKHEVAAFFMIKFNRDEIPLYRKEQKKDKITENLDQSLTKFNQKDLRVILKTMPIEEKVLEISLENYSKYSQDETVLKFLNSFQLTLDKIYSDYSYDLNNKIKEFVYVLNSLMKQNSIEEALTLYLRIYELLEIKTMYATDSLLKRSFYRESIPSLISFFKETASRGHQFDWISYFDQALCDETAKAIFEFVINATVDQHSFSDAQSLCLLWLENEEVSKNDIFNYLQFIKNDTNINDVVKHYIEYVDIEAVQRELISILLKNKDYNTIIKVLDDLEFKNNMISDFQVDLFDAYYLTDQKPMALNYADNKINEGSVLMFKHIKHRLPDNLFKKFIKKYDPMSFYNHSSKLEVYLNLLIEHEDTDSLFVLLQKHGSYLLEYDYALSDEDKYKLYFDLVYRAVNNNGRQNYHKAANILRELIVRGHSNVAIGIKEEIIRQFPNRSALKDEFRKIKWSF